MEKEKRSLRIQRPVPRYRTIVAITDVAWRYDYPRNKEKCIWGIAGQFDNPKDREIAALVTMWLCDWTSRSFKAIKKVVSWFGKSPYKYIARKEYNFMIMECDQSEVIYNNTKRSDCYYFFEWIHDIISRYSSFYSLMQLQDTLTAYDSVKEILKNTKWFKGKSVELEAKINLFLYMMAHCFDDYQIDSSELRPPLFKHGIIPTCKSLSLITNGDKKDAYMDKVTDYLKWFSEIHPMTYWTGIAMYRAFAKEYPKDFKKFAKKYKVTRHLFRKKY